MTGQRTGEKGMMTVEAVLCLVPFILAILGIISFTNIFMVHSRIQHAIYESASELSAYTYLYQVTQLRAADKRLDADSQELTEFLESFDDARTALGGLTGGNITEDTINDAADQVEDAFNKGMDLAQRPKDLAMNTIAKLLSLGSDELKNGLLELLEDWMVSNYLDNVFPDNTGQSADEYLKAFGVKDGVHGLQFDNSRLFTDDDRRLIDIVVEYDLEIYFFKLFLKDPTIHVVQRAAVPAWLDGDGGTYHDE